MLDGLRGLAAVCVFLHHASNMGIYSFVGHFGVAVFFALSGFLMAFLYGGRPLTASSAFSYGVSRFARIAPLYLSVILASWLIRTYVDGQFIYDINNHNIFRHLLFAGSEGVFWSIPPEVQFYVFFVILWWAIYSAQSRYYRPLFIAGGITFLMLIVNYLHPLPGTTLPSKLPFFLLGAGAGLARNWLENQKIGERLMTTLQSILLMAAFLYALCLFGFDHNSQAIYLSGVLPVLCAMMVLALSIQTRFSLNFFGNRVMREYGKWSFSIYLLHQPCLYWARDLQHSFHLVPGASFILGGVLTLAFSAVLQLVLEQPAQQYLRRWSRKMVSLRSWQIDGTSVPSPDRASA